MQKWHKFSKRRPKKGYFVYTQGSTFHIGQRENEEDGDFYFLGHQARIFCEDEIITQKLVLYWTKLDIRDWKNLVKKDVWDEEERALSETAKDQTPLLESELLELKSGKKWAKRTYNTDYLEPQAHKK